MIPDLSHIDTWLFDLDNTLYPEESGFMTQVEGKMTDFVERVTGLPREEAYALQKKYYAQHGLTLTGLIKHHGVEPADFFANPRHEYTQRLLASIPGKNWTPPRFENA